MNGRESLRVLELDAGRSLEVRFTVEGFVVYRSNKFHGLCVLAQDVGEDDDHRVYVAATGDGIYISSSEKGNVSFWGAADDDVQIYRKEI